MGVSERKTESVDLPGDFLTRMKHMLGEEYPDFLRSYETGRAYGLRFNTQKDSLDEMISRHQVRFGLSPVPWCREGFYYEESTRPGRSPYHEAGVYYLQEPSAMAAVELLDPQPGERILDLCAAPGGKTTHIAERLGGRGLLVSNEVHPTRAKILSQNVERMGAENVVVMNEETGRLAARFPAFFDRIVVDAPCSGEGMFRKDIQARTQWSLEHVRDCVRMQKTILDDAAAMLKPGGCLVYSTCTFAPEEDEENAVDFLNRHPDFAAVSAPDEWADFGFARGCPAWTRDGAEAAARFVRIWPHRSGGEGHFLALFRKEATAFPDVSEKKRREKKQREKSAEDPLFWHDRTGISLVNGFLGEILSEEGKADRRWREGFWRNRLIRFGDQIYRLPDSMETLTGFRVLRPGLHLGTMKKNRFEPSHALALNLGGKDVLRRVNYPADSREILDYLTGNTLRAEGSGDGWTLVCVDGYSLGWAKASHGVLKNHYPKGLRIAR